jgi:hypothetical protein
VLLFSVLYNFGIAQTPWILGRDIAGVVQRVGSKVTNVAVGERVWLCADSRDVRAGAYQAYSVARSVHVGRILSQGTSDQEAATLGTGLVTAAIVAYWFFDWNRAASLGGKAMARESNSASSHQQQSQSHGRGRGRGWVLIYGGATVTGIYLAQLARLSGMRVISIASPANFEYLKSLGVLHCINRNLAPEEVQEEVIDIVGDDGVDYCMDAVGSKTATICHGILRAASSKQSTSSSQMICLAGDPKVKSVNANHDRPAKMRKTIAGTRESVITKEDEEQHTSVKVHKISFSTTFYGDDVFASSVLHDLDALLQSNELQPARPEVFPDGLAGVRRGLESLRDNLTPSAKKLVVNIADTPHSHVTNLGVRSEMGWNGAV